MNPQMMGMNNQKFSTIQELWKNEKSKYRHWIIILGIGMLAITTLTIIAFVMNLFTKSEIIQNYKNNSDLDPLKVNIDNLAQKYFNQNYIFLPSIQIVSMIVGIGLYIVSTYAAYKAKNFARLSSWPTMIIGIGAFIAFISIMTLVFSGVPKAMFQTRGAIFSFVNTILFIVIYFAASSPVAKVRRTFIFSERMEQLQNSPNFQTMQQQMQTIFQGGAGATGPFGPSTMQTQTPEAKQEDKKPVQNVRTKLSLEEARLKKLSLVKLKKVAKTLSISGYSNMKKDELIKAILRVTGSD